MKLTSIPLNKFHASLQELAGIIANGAACVCLYACTAACQRPSSWGIQCGFKLQLSFTCAIQSHFYLLVRALHPAVSPKLSHVDIRLNIVGCVVVRLSKCAALASDLSAPPWLVCLLGMRARSGTFELAQSSE